jgi:hypothetical protein
MSNTPQDITNVTEQDRNAPLAQARARQKAAWQAGGNETVEQLLEVFPELKNDREAVLDLIYLEILHRDNRGESPTLAEYRRRFPALTARLTVLFPH